MLASSPARHRQTELREIWKAQVWTPKIATGDSRGCKRNPTESLLVKILRCEANLLTSDGRRAGLGSWRVRRSPWQNGSTVGAKKFGRREAASRGALPCLSAAGSHRSATGFELLETSRWCDKALDFRCWTTYFDDPCRRRCCSVRSLGAGVHRHSYAEDDGSARRKPRRESTDLSSERNGSSIFQQENHENAKMSADVASGPPGPAPVPVEPKSRSQLEHA